MLDGKVVLVPEKRRQEDGTEKTWMGNQKRVMSQEDERKANGRQEGGAGKGTGMKGVANADWTHGKLDLGRKMNWKEHQHWKNSGDGNLINWSLSAQVEMTEGSALRRENHDQ